ncbi:MAG: N-glycosylase/DNA lyase [Thermoplasmata archaeon]
MLKNPLNNKDYKNITDHIKDFYTVKHNIINSRLKEFKKTWKTGSDDEIFAELVFCILTPQSKAKICWRAVENLRNKKLLLKGNKNQIARELNGVRFKNNKAEYIVEARKLFLENGKFVIKSKFKTFRNTYDARDWLVHNVKGIGYKEASHFLRNIGKGENLAILDRHILKNLKLLKVIEKIPDSLSKRKYLEIEDKMLEFARKIHIPISHLDLLLWSKETGEVFK